MTVRTMALGDIDLSGLVVIKEVQRIDAAGDHRRWILRTRRGAAEPLVYKLWTPTYLRRDSIPLALEAGFYGPELTPGLLAVVMQDGVCRGYVMEHGARPARLDGDFVRRLWAATLRTGWCTTQFAPHHLRATSRGLTLIDLEGVWRIPDPGEPDRHLHFDTPDYAAFVAAVRAGAATEDGALSAADAYVARVRRVEAEQGPPSLAWLRRKVDGLTRKTQQAVRNACRARRFDLSDL